MNKNFIKKSVTIMLSLFILVTSIENTYAKTYSNNKSKTTKYTSSYSALKKQTKKPFLATRGSYISYIDMKATAYTAGKGAYTASGLPAKVGNIAVDPKLIPLGTKLYIKSLDGSADYGYAIAADTGGAIKNKVVDLFFNTTSQCYSFGNRTVRVYILGK